MSSVESLERGVEKADCKVYKIRWLILGVSAIFYASNQFQWLQYTIITDVMIEYYQTSADAVNWTSLIFFAVYIPGIFPVSYIMDKWGLRNSIILSAVFNCAGTLLKVASVAPGRFWIGFSAQTLVAVAQIFMLAMPSKVAAVWFGTNQVSTACSIGLAGHLLGVAFGTIIPPMLLKATYDQKKLEYEFYILFIAQGGATVILLLLILIFVKDKPPTPPSLAQSKIRKESPEGSDFKNFLNSLKMCFSNYNFLFFLVSYGINTGAFDMYSTLLNQIVLKPHPEAAEDVGRLGFLLLGGGWAGAIACGIVLDKYQCYKGSAIVTYILVLLCTIALIFALDGTITMLYLWATIYGFFTIGLKAIGYEFTAELTYPVPEGTSVGVLQISSQLLGIVFTHAYTEIDKHFDTFWGTGATCIALIVGIIFTIFIKADLRRLAAEEKNVDIDKTQCAVNTIALSDLN